jgi:HK97 gp10 family phage protein
MAKEIIGLDSLMRKLDNMGGNVIGALEKAVKNTVQVAISDAQANVPTDTGMLKQSLAHGSDVKVEPDKVIGIVGTNAYYAAFVEFGTGPKGQADHMGISPQVPVTYTDQPWVFYSEKFDSYVTTKGQAAHPFLYPAAKTSEPVFERFVRVELNKAIAKTAGGG